MAHTIELKKVSKYYSNNDAVSMGISRVDLDLDIGEFVVITGESGGGKSTLLNVISGLDSYEEGEMHVCGEDTTAFDSADYENYRKTYICNIFQDFNLIGSYTVYQNVELMMLINGHTKKECKERVPAIIEEVGLSKFSKRKVSKLSGGQKQRVAIARAIAKDAPIIVADEPTGNLDSESAGAVMETLSRVARDKLVVIVTHNYEQAEAYATRKLTMHDGRIIDDRRVREPSISTELENAEASAAAFPKRRPGMLHGSEVRLGLRNTFNLPAKFILLLIVYVFASAAVLGQYASTANSVHQNELMGINPYFTNTSPDRLIIRKQDESAFTSEDIEVISKTENIDTVVPNDIEIDNSVCFDLDDYFVKGTLYPYSQLKEKELTYGHEPRNIYEIVIHANSSSGAFLSLSNMGESMIGREIEMQDADQKHYYNFMRPLTVAGIIIDDDISEDSEFDLYGDSEIYVSDKVSNLIMVHMTAANSETEINYGGTPVKTSFEQVVFPHSDIEDGSVIITDEQKFYYPDDRAKDKDLRIRVHNRYFDSVRGFKIKDVVNADSIEKVLGIDTQNYLTYQNCVFVSEGDFDKLFNKGSFQASAFMINETESDKTLQALRNAGFTALAVKDTLTDATGGYGSVIYMMDYGRLALEFLLLFFITYAVIRLIMRSRRSYYSTLRMLGSTRKNVFVILRVELILVMAIAYAAVIGAAELVLCGYIAQPEISELLDYLKPQDYAVLAAVLLLMSLLIARRYSRRIFAGSVMKLFREEA